MPNTSCWPRELLREYLVGATNEHQLVEIESHVADCANCEQTLLELESDPDTLLVSLRRVSKATAPPQNLSGSESAVVQRAVEIARQIPATPQSPVSSLNNSIEFRGRIGAYELVRPLGRGGMGLVMLARHTSLHKDVAIKLLPSLLGDRPELVNRFQREMRAAGQLRHPSIVNATDAGAEQGTHYLVMELIDGLDLSRIVRLTGPLAIADACELARQAALGLTHAHAAGIVHRDIKPSNLMLNSDGQVKILDFGLAQVNLWDEVAGDLTTVGQLMGTLDYMAPEQAQRSGAGSGAVDHRADLYALGATLFRLLTGRAPLDTVPGMSLLEKVRLLDAQPAHSPSDFRSDCPEALDKLVQRLLNRRPEDRPSNADEVANALSPFCTGHDLRNLLRTTQEQANHEQSASEPQLALSANSMAKDLSSPGSVTPLSSERVAPTHSHPNRIDRFWKWIAFSMAPLLVLAGVMITLDTQRGQLVIESEVGDVQVRLLRNGQTAEQMSVRPGAQSTRLLADKYEITIDGASDSIVLAPDAVEVKRGETVVARITRKERIATNTTQAMPRESEAGQPKSDNDSAASDVADAKSLDSTIAKLEDPNSAMDLETVMQLALQSTNRSVMTDRAQLIERRVFDYMQSVAEQLHAENDLTYQQINSKGIWEVLQILRALWSNEFDEKLAKLCSTGADPIREVVFLHFACNPGSMGFVPLGSRIRSPLGLSARLRLELGHVARKMISGELDADQRTIDAAGMYLITFIAMPATVKGEEEELQRQSIGVLVNANRISPWLWMHVSLKKDSQGALRRMQEQAALKVLSEPSSDSFAVVRALQIVDFRDDKLPMDWLLPRLEELIQAPQRMQELFSIRNQIVSGTDPEMRRGFLFSIVAKPWRHTPGSLDPFRLTDTLNELTLLSINPRGPETSPEFLPKLKSIRSLLESDTDHSPRMISFRYPSQPVVPYYVGTTYEVVDPDAWLTASDAKRKLHILLATLDVAIERRWARVTWGNTNSQNPEVSAPVAPAAASSPPSPSSNRRPSNQSGFPPAMTLEEAIEELNNPDAMNIDRALSSIRKLVEESKFDSSDGAVRAERAVLGYLQRHAERLRAYEPISGSHVASAFKTWAAIQGDGYDDAVIAYCLNGPERLREIVFLNYGGNPYLLSFASLVPNVSPGATPSVRLQRELMRLAIQLIRGTLQSDQRAIDAAALYAVTFISIPAKLESEEAELQKQGLAALKEENQVHPHFWMQIHRLADPASSLAQLQQRAALDILHDPASESFYVIRALQCLSPKQPLESANWLIPRLDLAMEKHRRDYFESIAFNRTSNAPQDYVAPFMYGVGTIDLDDRQFGFGHDQQLFFPQNELCCLALLPNAARLNPEFADKLKQYRSQLESESKHVQRWIKLEKLPETSGPYENVAYTLINEAAWQSATTAQRKLEVQLATLDAVLEKL